MKGLKEKFAEIICRHCGQEPTDIDSEEIQEAATECLKIAIQDKIDLLDKYANAECYPEYLPEKAKDEISMLESQLKELEQ